MMLRKLNLVLFALLLAAGWSAAAVAQGRRIQANDQLQIRVLNQPEFDTQLRVSPDGTISLPHLGRIRVEGMTEDGVASAFRRALQRRDVVKNAEVVVTTLGFGAQVSISGAVRGPGVQTLDRPTTLAEAITRAGGASLPAGTVVVRRRTARGVQVARYDQKLVLTSRDRRSNPYVSNGDQIYLEEAPVFFLYGYVSRPGVYPLTRTLTVQQALATGGGLTELGSDWRIDIKRQRQGVIEVLRVGLDEPVLPNDTIVVNERFF
jgi:polysaccharide biosynthesis/export protein